MMHVNVVPLVGVVESNNRLLIVTPLFEFGCLKDYLSECGQMLDTATLTRFCLDCARGVEYLDEIKIVHRDIAVCVIFSFLCPQKENKEGKTR